MSPYTLFFYYYCLDPSRRTCLPKDLIKFYFNPEIQKHDDVILDLDPESEASETCGYECTKVNYIPRITRGKISPKPLEEFVQEVDGR